MSQNRQYWIEKGHLSNDLNRQIRNCGPSNSAEKDRLQQQLNALYEEADAAGIFLPDFVKPIHG